MTDCLCNSSSWTGLLTLTHSSQLSPTSSHQIHWILLPQFLCTWFTGSFLRLLLVIPRHSLVTTWHLIFPPLLPHLSTLWSEDSFSPFSDSNVNCIKLMAELSNRLLESFHELASTSPASSLAPTLLLSLLPTTSPPSPLLGSSWIRFLSSSASGLCLWLPHCLLILSSTFSSPPSPLVHASF